MRALYSKLCPWWSANYGILARIYLSRQTANHTLQPTALINEAYLRVLEWNPVEWKGRAQFYAVAAKMMRRILVTHAVAHNRQKRAGTAILVSLSEAGGTLDRTEDLVALDQAIEARARLDARKAELIELNYFGGLSSEEAAEVPGISPRSAYREVDLARAWLFRELRG